MSGGWEAVETVMLAAVSDGTTPGAVLLVGRGDEIIFEKAYGVLEAGGEEATIATVYDLASLTKPLLTTPCLMVLAAEGSIELDQPAARWIPALAAGEDSGVRSRITIADLLGHRSGLPAWRPYFEQLEPGSSDSEAVIDAAAGEDFEYLPTTASLYSDVGFILLGRVVEAASGESLAGFSRRCLLEPLGAGPATFVDVARGDRLGPTGVAPCGYSRWRDTVVRGVASDDNAYAMGGVAGHAGLFASVREVHLLVAEYLAALAGHGKVLDRGLVERLWTEPSVPGSTWKLGWDGPDRTGSSAGRHISEAAVGHLGWSGTSVWVDPVPGVHVVLLTNRVHPDQGNKKIQALRPALHDAVFEALAA